MDLDGPSDDLRRYFIAIHLCALCVSVVNVCLKTHDEKISMAPYTLEYFPTLTVKRVF